MNTLPVGFRRGLKIHPGKSHALQLAAWLVSQRIAGQLPFNWLLIRHDADCVTLATGHADDCRCDCEVNVGGRTYSFLRDVKGRAA